MARPRDPEPHGPAWLVQAALVARRFYLEGRSKTEIADELDLSRFKVARILEDAREQGLVQITVRLPAQIDAELSAALLECYGLRRAVVIEPGRHTGAGLLDVLGHVAADLLTEVVGPDDVLGLTCSQSVSATAAALRELAPCPVVQLTGTLVGPNQETGSVESVRSAAGVSGGKAYLFYAPMVLPDAATAAALRAEKAVRTAFAQFPAVTVALVAIGAWDAGLSTVWETLDEPERREVAEAGGVGEIGARVFGPRGEPVCTTVDERALGIGLGELHAVPEVIGLARDPRRAAAVHAAVTGGLVNSLVCDADLARALLDVVAKQRNGR